MTISVSAVDDTMPPIIGTATRCMISELVPVLRTIGSRPAMMATHGHHLGPDAVHGAGHHGVVQILPAERLILD